MARRSVTLPPQTEVDEIDANGVEIEQENGEVAAPPKRGRPAKVTAPALDDDRGLAKPTKVKVEAGRKIVIFENVALSSFALLKARIVSTAPLIQQQFSAKKRDDLLAEHMQTGKSTKRRAPKNPPALFLDALHIIGPRPTDMEDETLRNARYGMPSIALKKALERAAKTCGGVMTDTRTAVFVQTASDDHYLFEIHPDSIPTLRTDATRNASGVIDIRVRPEFKSWTADIEIEYNARVLSAERLVTYLAVAGRTNGLGEMRPFGRQSSGNYGTFRVQSAEAIVPDLSD